MIAGKGRTARGIDVIHATKGTQVADEVIFKLNSKVLAEVDTIGLIGRQIDLDCHEGYPCGNQNVMELHASALPTCCGVAGIYEFGHNFKFGVLDLCNC